MLYFIICKKQTCSPKLKNLDDIKIWITDDELNMPLMIEKKAKYGIIKMKLENYEK